MVLVLLAFDIATKIHTHSHPPHAQNVSSVSNRCMAWLVFTGRTVGVGVGAGWKFSVQL
jgi:hypothetical protein